MAAVHVPDLAGDAETGRSRWTTSRPSDSGRGVAERRPRARSPRRHPRDLGSPCPARLPRPGREAHRVDAHPVRRRRAPPRARDDALHRRLGDADVAVRMRHHALRAEVAERDDAAPSAPARPACSSAVSASSDHAETFMQSRNSSRVTSSNGFALPPRMVRSSAIACTSRRVRSRRGRAPRRDVDAAIEASHRARRSERHRPSVAGHRVGEASADLVEVARGGWRQLAVVRVRPEARADQRQRPRAWTRRRSGGRARPRRRCPVTRTRPPVERCQRS